MSEDFQSFGSEPLPIPRPVIDRPIAKLAEALSKAQGAFVAPRKNREVDFVDKNGRRVKYNYADLADVLESIKKPLSDNALALIHRLEYFGPRYGLTTLLMHTSGEYEATWYPLPDPGAIKPQEFGSAITYARRYSVSALIGLASEEDDDGANAPPAPKAEDKKAKGPSPVQPKKPTPEPIPAVQDTGLQHPTQAQLARLFTIATQAKWTTDQVRMYLETRWTIDSTSKLTVPQYNEMCELMPRKAFPQACTAIVKDNQNAGGAN